MHKNKIGSESSAEEQDAARKAMEAMVWNDKNNRRLLKAGMTKEPVITTKEFWKRFELDLIDDLSLKELRNACVARGLNIKKKKKPDLQTRLEQSILDERELVRMEHEMGLTRSARDKEAGGGVYCVGNNNKGQLGLGHRRDRPELRCLHALSNVGVLKCYASFETESSFALTSDGSVYSWGMFLLWC